MKELFERRAVRRQRTAPVGRHPLDDALERHVQPHRRAVGVDRRAILRIDERPAAGRDDRVARVQLILEHGALDRPEVRLAAPREDVRDRHMLARFDHFVDVRRAPVEPRRQRARDGRLAGRHEAHEIDLVRLHAISRSSVSKKSGYEIATASAPSIVDGPSAASAAIANAIAIR